MFSADQLIAHAVAGKDQAVTRSTGSLPHLHIALPASYTESICDRNYRGNAFRH